MDSFFLVSPLDHVLWPSSPSPARGSGSGTFNRDSWPFFNQILSSNVSRFSECLFVYFCFLWRHQPIFKMHCVFFWLDIFLVDKNYLTANIPRSTKPCFLPLWGHCARFFGTSCTHIWCTFHRVDDRFPARAACPKSAPCTNFRCKQMTEALIWAWSWLLLKTFGLHFLPEDIMHIMHVYERPPLRRHISMHKKATAPV